MWDLKTKHLFLPQICLHFGDKSPQRHLNVYSNQDRAVFEQKKWGGGIHFQFEEKNIHLCYKDGLLEMLPGDFQYCSEKLLKG